MIVVINLRVATFKLAIIYIRVQLSACITT